MESNFAFVCVAAIVCSTAFGLIWIGCHYALELKKLGQDEEPATDEDIDGIWESITVSTTRTDNPTP